MTTKTIKKEFPIEEWENSNTERINAAKPMAQAASVEPANATTDIKPRVYAEKDLYSQVKMTAERLKANGYDITSSYQDWLNTGFALSDGLGENGRDIYHLVSSLYPNYNQAECDKQYDACLKSHGHGITINTFFHMAKQAGVDLVGVARQNTLSPHNPQNGEMGEKEMPQMPNFTFTDRVPLEYWPKTLQKLQQIAEDKETADMLTVGIITATSACLPKFIGNYDRHLVYACLYAFIVAPPASNKGSLSALHAFIKCVNDSIRRANKVEFDEYEQKLAEYQAQKGKKGQSITEPKQPPYRSLLINANSSATAMYQALSDNHECGFTFESEGDAMSNALKSDYGDYSDGIRKAFHHEPISYSRRKENERVDIKKPRWAILLTGTPDQVGNLIPTADNGTFSRFLFYILSRKMDWRDVFAEEEVTLDDEFEKMGEDLYIVYLKLAARKDNLRFKLTPGQKRKFNSFFEDLQNEQVAMFGDDIVASVRRLGLIAFRIAMVLTALRFIADSTVDIQNIPEVICDDRDYEIAITMVNQLINHTSMVYSNLLRKKAVEEDSDVTTNMLFRDKQLYEKLTDNFTTKDLNAAAIELDIPEKTAEKIIGRFLVKYKVVVRIKNGFYRKVKPKDK